MKFYISPNLFQRQTYLHHGCQIVSNCSNNIVVVSFGFLYRDVCSLYRQDQEVCAAILCSLLPSIRCLTPPVSEQEDEMAHIKGALLKVISGFW